MLQLLLFTLLVLSLSLADPTPPCPAPFPNTAVGESWCSVPLASNPATGVSIAQYGLPAGSTLVTAATNPALWYDILFYLGGGIEHVLEYLALAKVIQNARTVPIVIRPQSPHGTPAGWWLTSMLVSPANYPSAASTLPPPNASTPFVVLEPLGEHAFATLDFNSTSCPPLYEPPYFTAFQRCDAMLAAGLPSGWVLKTDSQWTPSWLIYNKANYNGTWTSRCMAEVVKGGAATAPAAASAASAAPAAAPAAALPPARALAATAATAVTATATAAPPICALVLEFETFCWGAWAPPHSPNTPLDINGGSDGLHAKDDATCLIVYGTSSDTPFFGLRLAAINTATGAVSTVGSPWILPPPGYSGIGSQFLAVAHSPALGFVVLGYEISQLGPVPTRSSTPGTPLGWTVALAVDPATGSSAALSADLTPALGGYPPLVGGPSAMDTARSVLWVLSAGDGVNPLGPQGCGDSAGGRAAGHRVRRARRAAQQQQQHANSSSSSSLVGAAASGGGAPSTEAYFLGLPLAASPSATAAAAAPTALAIVGQGQVVTAFEYASAVDAIVALSYSICFRPPPYFGYCSSQVTLYPVNGSAPVLLGGTPAGQYSPMESVGSSAVSADGRFVYFGAVQPSATFESAALITVDTLTGAIQAANAAPTDDYDVLNLFRC